MIRLNRTSARLIKFFIFAIGILSWLAYRFIYKDKKIEEMNFDYCFLDRYLYYYIYSFTRFLSQNLHVRDLLLITGSNTLDVLMISYMAVYVRTGDSWKGITNLVIFYGVRGFIQNHITLNYYHTYLYTEPPFFSIFVPVFRSADFFWSGHCGITLIAALQFRDWGYRKAFFCGLFISFWEGFVMTSIRAHYSIDIIFGWLIAHYSYWWSGPLADLMDKKLNIFGRNFDHKSYLELKSLKVSSINEDSKHEEIKSKSDFTV